MISLAAHSLKSTGKPGGGERWADRTVVSAGLQFKDYAQ